MAGIYNRDNIQYAPMIQNAIANAKETGATRAKYSKNQYDIAADLARAGARTAEGYFSDDPDRAGWASYIISGDRSALEAARARAQQKAAQDAQFAQQEKMQKAQQQFQREQAAKNFGQQMIMGDINTKNAIELAKAQKKIQDEYNRDEWQKQYSIATADYDSAKSDLRKDPNNIDKQRAFNRAKANVTYWGGKLNLGPYDLDEMAHVGDASIGDASNAATDTPATTGSDEPDYSNAEIEKNLNEIFKGKWTDANAKKANDLVSKLPEGALKEEFKQRIDNKGKTIEQNKREFDALQAEALANLKTDPNALPPTGYKWVWKNGKKIGIAKK